MRLAPGTFLGDRVKTRAAGDFMLTEYNYGAGVRLRRHSHEQAYFSFVLSGSYAEQCLSRCVQCQGETMLYHPPEEDHSDRFGGNGARLFSIEVGPEWIKKLHRFDLVIDRPLWLSEKIVPSLSWRAYRAFLDPQPRSALVMESASIELLYQLPWKNPHPPDSGAAPWLRRAADILHSEYRDPFSLHAVAVRVGAHPVHLARTFRRRFGMTMGEYVRRLRLSHALEALGNSNSSLADIAEQAGFADQSHLGRVVRAVTGMTPLQIRNSRNG
jgi:AraC family transcriptional regulator